jgi:hypothetical protein
LNLILILAICSPVIDAPGGFLYEWWTVFWELFMAKQGLSNSEPALSYLQVRSSPFNIDLIDFSFCFLD